MEALETTTGVTGLAGHSPVREHIWVDPMEGNGQASKPRKKAAASAAATEDGVAEAAPAAEGESGRGRSRS
jgi:hypothetical protein